MKADYLCPHCRGLLNAGDFIVFSSRTSKGGHGIIMLHNEIGNYTVAKHPMFEYEQGEKLLFYCPMCNKELAFCYMFRYYFFCHFTVQHYSIGLFQIIKSYTSWNVSSIYFCFHPIKSMTPNNKFKI